MGVWKEYRALRNLKWAMGTDMPNGHIEVKSYKTIDGTDRTSILYCGYINNWNYTHFVSNSIENCGLYRGITPYATQDLLDSYNIDDYIIEEVGTTTFIRTDSYSNSIISSNFAINIANNTSSNIIVSCIKFKKNIYTNGDSLILAYFLSNPITIKPNSSGEVNLTILNSLETGYNNMKVYKAALTAQHSLLSGTEYNNPKDLTGTERSIKEYSQYIDSNQRRMANAETVKFYCNLIPVATTDLISNYNEEDYQINEALSTTYSVSDEASTSTGIRKKIYIITFTNNTSEAINISCIKFKKNIEGNEFLFYGYYILDENGNQDYITVPANGVKKYQFTITI